MASSSLKPEVRICQIPELSAHVDEIVSFTGWVEQIQKFKRHAFLILRDGTGSSHRIQVVVDGEDLPIVESYVTVTGKVSLLPVKVYSYQPVEVQASQVKVLSTSKIDFTTKCPSDAGSELKLEQRHFYLRDPYFALLTKARACFLKALRQTFEEMGCTEILPPAFVGNNCEGGATLFHLKHPDRDNGDIDCYLTQSSQFYLEYAVPGIGDCYCIYPSFRAERSHTRRHLTEFVHAEAEWSKILTFEDHLEKLKTLLYLTVKHFIEICEKDGHVLSELDKLGAKPIEKMLHVRIQKLLEMTKDIQVLTHQDAIKYCREHEIYKDPETKMHFEDRDDIPEAQERSLIDRIGKIVFLVKFPREHKSFYMKADPSDPSYVLGCDVEVPQVGEIIGSGVRVDDEKELLERIKEHGLKETEYCEYIDLRRYGHGKTSGMGLGVDRMLTWLLDLHSIREIVTFPRYPGRLTP